MSKKKKSEEIYLVGCTIKEISTRKLPTNRQTLQLFMYHHELSMNSIRDKAVVVANQIIPFWKRAGIPTRRFRNVIKQIINLHNEFKHLLKNKNRKFSLAKIEQENKFKKKLEQVFDIAKFNGKDDLESTQRIFLEGQRDKTHRGFIKVESETNLVNDSPENDVDDNNDMTRPLSQGMERMEVEKSFDDPGSAEINYAEVIDEEQSHVSGLSQISTTTTVSVEDGYTDNELERVMSNFEDELPQNHRRQKINVMTPELVAALDRTGTTSRNASFLFAAFLASLRLNVDDYNISFSAIHANRIKQREKIVQRLKGELEVAEDLVVHWDGKMLPEVTGTENVERLAILVTGLGTEQLLGIPKLSSSTGLAQATAVRKTLVEWNVTDRVKALCFDTTSSNTGRLNGACTLIEKQLGRRLLHLACRHHIRELMLRSVFETCWPTTVGPNVAVFVSFKKCWPSIDTANYRVGLEDPKIAKAVGDQTGSILQFIENQFLVHHPRDDYRELLELVCIFLGGIPHRGIKFKAPGAAHHARWLAKAIYSLKIFMFKSQFKMKAAEIAGLRDICVFIVLFYVKSWFTSPDAIRAPHSDLTLLQNLIEYSKTNVKVGEAAIAKVTNHLWYLSEELVGLGFFDSSVSSEVKIKMRDAMRLTDSSGINTTKCAVKKVDWSAILSQDLSHFVTKRSRFLFDQFGISTNFLDEPPDQWELNEDFQYGLKVFKDLKVTNDVAERGVALIQEFNGALTKDEEQRQYALQIIKNHRKMYLTPKKQNFSHT